MNFSELIETIDRQRRMEYDMIVPRNKIQFMPTPESKDGIVVRLPEHPDFVMNEVFTEQVREAAGIPSRYFDACRQQIPGLNGLNLNAWFQHSKEESLVRSFYDPEGGVRGVARAFLSPSYDRTWGHAAMVQGLLDAGELMGSCEFVSCEVTEKRLYVKAILPGLEGTILPTQTRVGDAFRAGFEFRNSETGFSRGAVLPFVEILGCKNGMSFTDFGAWSKVHRAKREVETGELRVIYASDTIKARREALAKEIRDALRQVCSMETVRQVQDAINGVATIELRDPEQSVKLLAKSYDLTVEETKLVDANVALSGDRTRWGLIQAVTNVAGRVQSYDRASELEALGAKLLAPSAWTVLEKAA